MADVTLISHPSVAWHGARELKTAQDGWLLCVTRRPLFAACERLREEGFEPDTMVTIIDNMNIGQPIAGRIKDVLR